MDLKQAAAVSGNEATETIVDFADELGPAFLNLAIRRLSRRLSAEGDLYFARHDLKIPARATATIEYLARNDNVSIAAIADALGYSHQAVTQAVGQLEKAGLVVSGQAAEDMRVRRISMTEEGRAEVQRLDAMLERITRVFNEIFAETGSDLFEAVRQFEMALDRRSLVERFVDAELADETTKPH